MSLNNSGLFTFVMVEIALLLVFWMFSHWWCEQPYNLQGKTVLVTECRCPRGNLRT
ncbi:MAG TPA: hypothetical protein IGS53_05210 [Leptolyngbyaceae cyanobacterium M33_DOE_097]|nr:hypothetical protein [Leptolyngbyaceae cyanobacterium M33_DOE_097]